MKNKPRILLLDIEILPDLKAALRVWPRLGDFPGRTLKADINSIINFGFKDLDGKRVGCINAWDFAGWKRNVNDDKKLCKEIYGIVKDYHGVVTQNGKKFDWPFIETRLLIHDFPRLPKLQHFDTKVAANCLSFVSKSLRDMAHVLTNTEKMENEGWPLWEKVWHRDPKAMQVMEKYCKQDVRTLEAVFHRLRKFSAGGNTLPNHNLFLNHAIECCPTCGGFNFRSEGFRTTKTVIYRRLYCQDCGASAHSEVLKKLPKGTAKAL